MKPRRRRYGTFFCPPPLPGTTQLKQHVSPFSSTFLQTMIQVFSSLTFGTSSPQEGGAHSDFRLEPTQAPLAVLPKYPQEYWQLSIKRTKTSLGIWRVNLEQSLGMGGGKRKGSIPVLACRYGRSPIQTCKERGFHNPLRVTPKNITFTTFCCRCGSFYTILVPRRSLRVRSARFGVVSQDAQVLNFLLEGFVGIQRDVRRNSLCLNIPLG